MPKNKDIKKVLVIGSGPIVIGQAAEFDYSGTQACRILKKEGIEIVLVNSNPATIMTDRAMADYIYLEPLTLDTLKRIIAKERPDCLLSNIGGQTGLTLGMKLYESGFLDKMNVKMIGSNFGAIMKSEDRDLFKQTMAEINQPVIESDIATNIEDAKEVALRIGFPVIIRPAFTLGGEGGGIARNMEEFITIASNGILLSPIDQILVEKYIAGYKEIEFEVIRDRLGKVITICSMENVDPVGVHTGDSIVVAPALTLNDHDYKMLNDAAVKIITALGIEGGCNVQFALSPTSSEYAVIEVNPRVSRSSALASKATGYPIAKITTRIALGYTLDEILPDFTTMTADNFDPAVDYIVCKMPKWPFDKFSYASRELGTKMKATGEVMSIGTSFEMALLKAIRGAEINLDYLENSKLVTNDLISDLAIVDDLRLFRIYKAIKENISLDQIHDITKITKYFLEKIKNIVDYEFKIKDNMNDELYLEGKMLGFPDEVIKRYSNKDITPIAASYKMVDTGKGKKTTTSPYFYSTYGCNNEALNFIDNKKEKVIVLGSGPIRIGQGIEFDYSSVHCTETLKKMGYEVIIINNNPETVSTDFDTADRLYFEPLTKEDVLNIIRQENPIGVVVAFGGQTAIKLTEYLDSLGIRILGTSAQSIDIAEDRSKFLDLLESLNIECPRGLSVLTLDDALKAANSLEYPVLVRPSYVIGGQNMIIAYNDDDVTEYMNKILSQKIENPVLVDKYLQGTEVEVDAICDGKDVLIPSVMEHIERAGVHSGDSITVYPPQNINDKLLNKIYDYTRKLALGLNTRGLINIQYVIHNNEVYVIEVNPRASRTIPYISKVTGIPMVDIACHVMLGESLESLSKIYKTGDIPPYVAVKVPVFSFEKINDANALLGPEMKSTGEVLGIGHNLAEALFKGLVSAGFNINPRKQNKGVFISVCQKDRLEIVSTAKLFNDLGITIYATPKTKKAIEGLGIDVIEVKKVSKSNEIFELLEKGMIDYIVYTCDPGFKAINNYIRLHRRALQLKIASLTSLDTAKALAFILKSRFNEENTELIDINNLRSKPQELPFVKMQGASNDYIFFNNFNEEITCPESLAITVCDRFKGIGGDGIVLIEKSEIADAKIRIFNKDGSEGEMAGNSIRCVGKYLHDKLMIKKENITIETLAGLKKLKLYLFNNEVNLVEVNMGKVMLKGSQIPVKIDKELVVNEDIKVGNKEFKMTCVNVGNPHAVVFVNRVDNFDVSKIGPLFENHPLFPARVNAEFIRVVNKNLIKMRAWERGNGETLACGTGAAAAVVAAYLNGLVNLNEDVVVQVTGGDLIVRYDGEEVYLTGNASLIYEGMIKY